MKILTVSDKVVPKLTRRPLATPYRDVELILACGDLPPEYLLSLSNAFEVPVFYVRGNHDIRHFRQAPAGTRNLHGRLVRFRGLRLLGLEGSRWYNGGPLQYTEKEMARMIRRLWFSIWWRRGVDIVISHAPPRHIHDRPDLCHRGFVSYRKLIKRHRPQFFIHGHIHAHFENAAQRMTLFHQTRVINAYGHHIFTIDLKADQR